MADSQSNKPNRTCRVCKSTFYAKPSDINRGGGLYCSRKCWLAWHSAPLEKRFKKYIGEKDENGCILWNGARLPSGYGRVFSGGDNGKGLYAHRVAWSLKNGPIPDGLEIMHKCDNPRCVNHEHLVPGTQQDNIVDAASKGRMPQGDLHKNSKLTTEKVLEARKLYESGGRTQQELADQFGVTRMAIMNAIRKKTWKHI